MTCPLETARASSRSWSAPGSSGRAAHTSTTGISVTRSAMNTSHRNEAVSAQCRSSATNATGRRAESSATSQYWPCNRENTSGSAYGSAMPVPKIAATCSGTSDSRSGSSATVRSSSPRTSPAFDHDHATAAAAGLFNRPPEHPSLVLALQECRVSARSQLHGRRTGRGYGIAFIAGMALWEPPGTTSPGTAWGAAITEIASPSRMAAVPQVTARRHGRVF